MPKSNNSDEKALKTVAKGAGLVFIALIISRGLGYLTRLIIAKNFGPDGYGLVYLAASIFGIFSLLCTLGLQFALERYVPEFRAKKQWGKLKGAVTGSLKISFSLGLVVGSVLFILAPQISDFLFQNQSLTLILRIFTLSLPFSSAVSTFVYTTKGFQIVKYYIYSEEIGKPILTLILVLVFITIGIGFLGIATSYAMAIVFSFFLSFYFMERKVFSILNRKIKSENVNKRLIVFSAPLIISYLIWSVITCIDTIMIGYFLNAYEVGIYQAAAPTSQLMLIASSSIAILFLPVITDLFSRKKFKDLTGVYRTVTKWVVYVNLPFLFIFIIFSKAILNVFFGTEFMEGSIALSILSVGYISISITLLSHHIIDLYEKTKFHLYNTIVSISLAIFLNLLLIPRWGLIGAALATTITLIVLSMLRLSQAYYISKIWPFSLNMAKSFLSLFISALFLIVAKNMISNPSIPVLFVLGLMFFLFYGVLIIVMRGLDKEDMIILKSIENKTGIRIGFIRNFIKKFV